MLAQQLSEHIVLNIKKMKHPFMSLNMVQDFLKEKLGDEYTSQLSIQVKEKLKEHRELDFFKEGTYINEKKFYHCTGNWVAPKGMYDNPIQAKLKMGWYSWMESADDDRYID